MQLAPSAVALLSTPLVDSCSPPALWEAVTCSESTLGQLQGCQSEEGAFPGPSLLWWASQRQLTSPCGTRGTSLTGWPFSCVSPECRTHRTTLPCTGGGEEEHSLAHGWAWQGWSSRSGPRQGIPRPDGAGSVQKRCRFWRPRPQEAEHSLQDVQADQWPFTAREEPRRESVAEGG